MNKLKCACCGSDMSKESGIDSICGNCNGDINREILAEKYTLFPSLDW